MSRFADILGALSDRLDLPQPARSRLLIEIADDLEDLFEHHRRQGLSEAEARRRAIETCDLSDEALQGLATVHASGIRRLLDRLGEQAGSRGEWLLFLMSMLCALAVGIPTVLTSNVIGSASLAVWPILACAAGALLLAAWRLHVVFVRRDHRPRRLRRGLHAILALALVGLVLGVCDYVLETYLTALAIRADVDHLFPLLVLWLQRVTAMWIVCLLATIVSATFWFVLARKVACIERLEAAALMVRDSMP